MRKIADGLSGLIPECFDDLVHHGDLVTTEQSQVRLADGKRPLLDSPEEMLFPECEPLASQCLDHKHQPTRSRALVEAHVLMAGDRIPRLLVVEEVRIKENLVQLGLAEIMSPFAPACDVQNQLPKSLVLLGSDHHGSPGAERSGASTP